MNHGENTDSFVFLPRQKHAAPNQPSLERSRPSEEFIATMYKYLFKLSIKPREFARNNKRLEMQKEIMAPWPGFEPES